MKPSYLGRMLALIVFVGVLLSACTPIRPNRFESSKDQCLTVEQIPVAYTEAQTELFSTRLTDLLARAVRLFKGVSLSAAQITRAQTVVSEQVLPMLAREGITALEMETLCEYAETLCAQAEQSSNRLNFSAYSALYGESTLILGSERAGALAYESILLWQDLRISDAIRRYETYGYDFYLARSEEYRIQKDRFINEVGKQAYSSVLGTIFFGGSILNVLAQEAEAQDFALSLNDAEVLMLLKRHGQLLWEHTPTSAQWSACADLHLTWFSKTALDASAWSDLQKAEWKAFWTAERAQAIGGVGRDATRLYAAMTQAMTVQDVACLRIASQEERMATLCRLAITCEEELQAFAQAIATTANSADEAEKNALEKHGATEAYLAYTKQMQAVSTQEWMETLKEYATTPTKETQNALQDRTHAFFYGICPYMTFVFLEGGDKR